MRKAILFILFPLCLLSFNQIKAQNINFDYDEAGNCIVKYKTVVLPSNVKGNKNDTTKTVPQSEIISDREVIIYPNPTKGALKVEIRGKSPERPIQYVLTDLSGKSLRQIQSQEIYYVFDMTSFPSGIYLLRVMIDEKWSIWKIIKE